MRNLMPRARWLRAQTTGPRFRGGRENLYGLLRTAGATAVVGFAISQSACPIVALLARFAPTAQTPVRGMDAGWSDSGEECPPCGLAGTPSCWDELLRWIEAQFTGDQTVPFPAGECFDGVADAGNA